jgi:predicted transcriptional regulator
MNDQATEGLPSAELLRLTSDVVAAYVSNNPLQTAELTTVIQTVHSSLSVLNGGGEAKAEPQKPAVSIRRSVTPDYVVCLEDGKKLKMLKRHLRTTYGKWGLPADYPMVAPNYAKQRSAFAKKIGLGRSTKRRGKKRG